MKLFLLILTLHYPGGIVNVPYPLRLAKTSNATEFVAYGFVASRDEAVQVIKQADDMVYGNAIPAPTWKVVVFEIGTVGEFVDIRRVVVEKEENGVDTLKVED